MASKRKNSEKGKEQVVPLEFNRARFDSFEVKQRFDKAAEINTILLWRERLNLGSIYFHV